MSRKKEPIDGVKVVCRNKRARFDYHLEDRFEAGRDVDPLEVFDYTYAELPAELVEQKREFQAALDREGLRPQERGKTEVRSEK